MRGWWGTLEMRGGVGREKWSWLVGHGDPKHTREGIETHPYEEIGDKSKII